MDDDERREEEESLLRGIKDGLLGRDSMSLMDDINPFYRAGKYLTGTEESGSNSIWNDSQDEGDADLDSTEVVSGAPAPSLGMSITEPILSLAALLLGAASPHFFETSKAASLAIWSTVYSSFALWVALRLSRCRSELVAWICKDAICDPEQTTYLRPRQHLTVCLVLASHVAIGAAAIALGGYLTFWRIIPAVLSLRPNFPTVPLSLVAATLWSAGYAWITCRVIKSLREARSDYSLLRRYSAFSRPAA